MAMVMEDIATIIDKPVESLRCLHGNGPFMGQLMCGDKVAGNETILVLHTDEDVRRAQVDGYVYYEHCQEKKEEQPRMADMADDENVYDLLRMTGMAIHVNNKHGYLFKINEAGNALELIDEDIWEVNFHDYSPENEDPRTRVVPARYFAVVDLGGNGPWTLNGPTT
jgi:hypothetical protein